MVAELGSTGRILSRPYVSKGTTRNDDDMILVASLDKEKKHCFKLTSLLKSIF